MSANRHGKGASEGGKKVGGQFRPGPAADTPPAAGPGLSLDGDPGHARGLGEYFHADDDDETTTLGAFDPINAMLADMESIGHGALEWEKIGNIRRTQTVRPGGHISRRSQVMAYEVMRVDNPRTGVSGYEARINPIYYEDDLWVVPAEYDKASPHFYGLWATETDAMRACAACQFGLDGVVVANRYGKHYGKRAKRRGPRPAGARAHPVVF